MAALQWVLANGCLAAFGLLRQYRTVHPLAALWLGALIVVFWFPFEFDFESRTAAHRMKRLLNVPLYADYEGSEYMAITQVMRKALLFLPLGLLVGLLKRSTAVVVLATAATASLIELGQVFIPGKTLDLADIAFSTLGGFFGYLILNQLDPVGSPTRAPRHFTASTAASPSDVDRPARRRAWLLAPYGLFILVSAANTRSLPYNLRELFPADTAAFTGGALACVISLMAAAPAGFAHWLGRGRLVSRAL